MLKEIRPSETDYSVAVVAAGRDDAEETEEEDDDDSDSNSSQTQATVESALAHS